MKTVIKAAIGLGMLFATPVAAQEVHEVTVLRYGFLPETIYAQPGDTIRFINKSPSWARVFTSGSSDNYSGYNPNAPCPVDENNNGYIDGNEKKYHGSTDGWVTGWIARNASRDQKVFACTELTMLAPEIYRYGYSSSWNRGYISYDSPSLGF